MPTVKKTKKIVKKTTKTVLRRTVKKPTPKSAVTSVHHVFIVDSSGSMGPLRDVVISGFNEQVDVVEKAVKEGKLKQFVSLYTFADSPKNILWNEDSTKLQRLSRESYDPNGSTALNDTIGVALSRLKDVLKGRTDTDVVVTILTDGQENASKDWDYAKVKALLDDVQNNLKWTVTFIGANIDVQSTANTYGLKLSNTVQFTADADGATRAFKGMSSARTAYLHNASQVDYSLNSKSVSNFYNSTEETLDLTKDNSQSQDALFNTAGNALQDDSKNGV